MERLLRDIYDAIGSLRQRISYLETQDGVADLSDAMSFVQLTDAPDNYIGQAGKIVAVTAGEDGLEFVAGGGALADHDHSGDAGDGGTFDAANLTSGAATDGYVLTADGSGGAAWEVVSGGASELDDLTDVDLTAPPSDGQALVFDSGSSTWKAETLAGGVTDFIDLTDTPAAYTDTAGFFVSPNAGETALEFTRILQPTEETTDDYSLIIRNEWGTKDVVFHATPGTQDANLVLKRAGGAANAGPTLSLHQLDGTFASPSAVGTTQTLGKLEWWGQATSTVFTRAAYLEVVRDGAGTGGSFAMPGKLAIYVQPQDYGDSPINALQVLSSGFVGIGETSPEGQLHVGGEIALDDITTPDTPSAGIHKIYSKSDGIYVLNSSGSEIGPISVGAHDVFTNDVSNPPTDAELDSAIGTPATVGAGYTALLDDNGAGSNVYYVASDGTNWWYTAMTKAT